MAAQGDSGKKRGTMKKRSRPTDRVIICFSRLCYYVDTFDVCYQKDVSEILILGKKYFGLVRNIFFSNYLVFLLENIPGICYRDGSYTY